MVPPATKYPQGNSVQNPNTNNHAESVTAQVRFEKQYITATQLMKDLGLSRSGLQYARNTGKLPDPIVLNDGRLMIWEREQIQPYLDDWKQALQFRRCSAVKAA